MIPGAEEQEDLAMNREDRLRLVRSRQAIVDDLDVSVIIDGLLEAGIVDTQINQRIQAEVSVNWRQMKIQIAIIFFCDRSRARTRPASFLTSSPRVVLRHSPSLSTLSGKTTTGWWTNWRPRSSLRMMLTSQEESWVCKKISPKLVHVCICDFFSSEWISPEKNPIERRGATRTVLQRY